MCLLTKAWIYVDTALIEVTGPGTLYTNYSSIGYLDFWVLVKSTGVVIHVLIVASLLPDTSKFNDGIIANYCTLWVCPL